MALFRLFARRLRTRRGDCHLTRPDEPVRTIVCLVPILSQFLPNLGLTPGQHDPSFGAEHGYG